MRKRFKLALFASLAAALTGAGRYGYVEAGRHIAWHAGRDVPPTYDCRVCHSGPKQPVDPAPLLAAGHPKPAALVLSKSGAELFVVCEGNGKLRALDAARLELKRELAVDGPPRGLALDPTGATLAVTCARPDTLLLVDAASFARVASVPVGRTPAGVAFDESGAYAYVANSESDDISIVDVAARREVARLAAGRRPWAVALHAPSHRILVTSLLAGVTPTDDLPRCELTLLDTLTRRVQTRLFLSSAHLATAIAVAPDRPVALVALTGVRNLLPITQVARSWVTNAALAVVFLGEEPRAEIVPLDSFRRCHSDLTAVAFSPDGATAFAASGGGDHVVELDVARLQSLAEEGRPAADGTPLADRLDVPPRFLRREIETRAQPAALAVAADGARLFVAERLADSIVCFERDGAARRTELPHPLTETVERHGERVFAGSAITFQRQFSCQSCHPEGATDGLVYDFEVDGLARNPLKNRDLRGIAGTQPFKWNGKNATLQEQCGRRFASVLTRTEPFALRDLDALVAYLESLPASNRSPQVAALTPAQQRGKALFERSRRNDGVEIPQSNRCTTCHPAPFFTNHFTSDVGTHGRLDTSVQFDPPHLLGVLAGAPYLHDGRARSLEEIWTVFNADGKHGFSADWTKQQLNDLVAYLLSL